MAAIQEVLYAILYRMFEQQLVRICPGPANHCGVERVSMDLEHALFVTGDDQILVGAGLYIYH